MALQVMDYLSSGDEADISIQSESPPPSPRPTSAEMPNKHHNRKTGGPPHERRQQPKPKPKPELWTCDVCGCSIHEGLVPMHVVGVKHVKKTAERERLRSEGLLVAGGSGNESEFPAAADKPVPGTSSTDPALPDKKDDVSSQTQSQRRPSPLRLVEKASNESSASEAEQVDAAQSAKTRPPKKSHRTPIPAASGPNPTGETDSSGDSLKQSSSGDSLKQRKKQVPRPEVLGADRHYCDLCMVIFLKKTLKLHNAGKGHQIKLRQQAVQTQTQVTSMPVQGQSSAVSGTVAIPKEGANVATGAPSAQKQPLAQTSGPAGARRGRSNTQASAPGISTATPAEQQAAQQPDTRIKKEWHCEPCNQTMILRTKANHLRSQRHAANTASQAAHRRKFRNGSNAPTDTAETEKKSVQETEKNLPQGNVEQKKAEEKTDPTDEGAKIRIQVAEEIMRLIHTPSPNAIVISPSATPVHPLLDDPAIVALSETSSVSEDFNPDYAFFSRQGTPLQTLPPGGLEAWKQKSSFGQYQQPRGHREDNRIPQRNFNYPQDGGYRVPQGQGHPLPYAPQGFWPQNYLPFPPQAQDMGYARMQGFQYPAQGDHYRQTFQPQSTRGHGVPNLPQPYQMQGQIGTPYSGFQMQRGLQGPYIPTPYAPGRNENAPPSTFPQSYVGLPQNPVAGPIVDPLGRRSPHVPETMWGPPQMPPASTGQFHQAHNQGAPGRSPQVYAPKPRSKHATQGMKPTPPKGQLQHSEPAGARKLPIPSGPPLIWDADREEWINSPRMRPGRLNTPPPHMRASQRLPQRMPLPQPLPLPQPGPRPQHFPHTRHESEPQFPTHFRYGSGPQHTPNSRYGSGPQHTPQSQHGLGPQQTPHSRHGSGPQHTPQSQHGSGPQQTPHSRHGSGPQHTPQSRHGPGPQQAPQSQHGPGTQPVPLPPLLRPKIIYTSPEGYSCPKESEWNCEPCQFSCHIWGKEAHLRSAYHVEIIRRKMLENDYKPQPEPEPNRNLWTCKICFAICDKKDMGAHILGEKHGQTLRSQLTASRTARSIPGPDAQEDVEKSVHGGDQDEGVALVEKGMGELTMEENGKDHAKKAEIGDVNKEESSTEQQQADIKEEEVYNDKEQGGYEEGYLGGDIADDVDAYYEAELLKEQWEPEDGESGSLPTGI